MSGGSSSWKRRENSEVWRRNRSPKRSIGDDFRPQAAAAFHGFSIEMDDGVHPIAKAAFFDAEETHALDGKFAVDFRSGVPPPG
ncbi:MAG: hypothetical protein BGO12_16755 [Verrucomicrobia bacterium 61-8]|nr:MAG: hypothetical protein BGO12_16755 [Verrucomicrobia bacterium 61-8]